MKFIDYCYSSLTQSHSESWNAAKGLSIFPTSNMHSLLHNVNLRLIGLQRCTRPKTDSAAPLRVCFQSSDVQAVWTEDHALAWHLEEKFRQNSKVWALDKCVAWDQLEEKLPSFIRELTDCPCTLAQARADTGRFHVSVTKSRYT